MAIRKFLFMNQTDGYSQEQAASDELSLGKITLSGVSGVALDVGGQLVSNLAAPVNANDAARKVDVSTALTAAQSYADGIVATEAQAREAADNTLTAAVSAEVTARTNADSAITSAYQSADATEQAARIAADGVLQGNINTEQSARISADNTLTAAVSAEASARASADTQLGLDIDAEEAARIAADSSIRVDFAAADDALETDYIARDVVVLDTAKAYADSLQSGFIVKAPAKLIVRSDSAALTGLSAIDGVTPVAGDRILVARETPSIDNGIYVAASGAWSRASDMDVSADFKDGVSVFVEQGDVNADSTWVLITNNPITMNTTPVAFIQFSGLGQITAGLGLSKSGNTLDVNVGNGIYISSDAVAVDLSGTPGLQFESGKLAAKPDAARGLDKDGSGLYVKHDGAKALAMDASNGLQVVADANYGLAIDGSAGLRVDLSATPGLQFASGKLDAKNDPARGLGKDATGLFVKHDSSAAIAMDATDGLQVVADPSKALAIDSAMGLQVMVDEQRGLAIDGVEGVYVDLATDPGLQFTGGKLDHKLVSADRLTKSASGLDVVGVPSLFKINGSAVSANVTHTNLNTLTAGGFTLTGLHGHSTVYAKLNASGDVAASRAVYINGSGTVAEASCSATSTARVVGISYNIFTSSGSFVTFITSGSVAPVGQLLVPGTPYYLGSSGELVEFSALVSGDRVIRLGYASTANSLQLAIQDMGAKA
jgi:hypothetical protein